MKLKTEDKTFFIKTYGCAMNYSDSDRIRYIMKSAGYNEVPDEKNAKFIILNSCSIRQPAEDKILGWARKVKKFTDKKIILTGCMAIRIDRKTGMINEKYGKQLKRRAPWIDYVISDREYEKIPNIINPDNKSNSLIYKMTPQSDKFRGLFPISFGCDFFCSYCIVPFTRGELKNRDFRSIYDEVKMFVKNGGKIVTLVGQNVNSWKGKDVGNFTELLKKITSIKGDFWVNFISSNPTDFSTELSKELLNNEKLMKNVNLAVQSGSDKILGKMNRKYTVNEFIKIAKSLKDNLKEFRLTTDIIVGFPGETEEDFDMTLELLKKVDFDMVYLGKYSQRKGTVSSKFDDDVSYEEKERRAKTIYDFINSRRKFHNELWLGKTIRVLVIGVRRGISYYNHEVLYKTNINEKLIGQFVDCKVINANVSGLIVEII